ncbi:MAPEG family protein [Aestuariibius insulae]|uniref:MAPEG family protein n=1 Tax=Aestuariibius insulae TaxID=2058287 RepID=UPI00345E954D
MTAELTMMLAALFLLAVLTNVVQMSALVAGHGVGGMLRSRADIPVPKPGFAGRTDRAIDNLKENLFFFLPLCLLTAILGISNGWTAGGAQLFVAARVAHAVLYLIGVPGLRSAAFGVGTAGLVLMVIGLFIPI